MWSPLHIPRELKSPEERKADDESVRGFSLENRLAQWLQRWLSKNKDAHDDAEQKPVSKPSSPWNPEDCL